MADIAELRRTYTKIAAFDDFRPDQRIWWIYVRNVAIELASLAHYPALAAAVSPLKLFPENLPNERALWLKFRAAVADALSVEKVEQQPGFLGVLPVAADPNDVERDQANDAIRPVTYGRGLANVRGTA